MKTQRIGHKGQITTGLFNKLDFLTEPPEDNLVEVHLEPEDVLEEETEQEVIMDKQEYYEVGFRFIY